MDTPSSWMTDWLISQLTDGVARLLDNWMTAQLEGWLDGWLTKSAFDWLSLQLIYWPIFLVTNWWLTAALLAICGQTGKLSPCFMEQQTDLMTNWLTNPDRLTDL